VDRDGEWNTVVEKASGLLGPQKTVEWDGSRFATEHFYITEALPISIQAQVLVGPDQWVSSNIVPFKTVRKDMSRSPVVFDDFYLVGPKKVRRPAKVRRVAVGDTEFLFAGTPSPVGRICEIPKDATPRFEWNPEEALLTVRFPGTDVPPVRYNYKMLKPAASDPRPGPDSERKAAGGGEGSTKTEW
jgi:hypothetical protein